MTTGMIIARDTEGFRVEPNDEDDARILANMGRWAFELNGDAFIVRPDPEGTAVCFFKGTEGGRPSIRFVDFNTGHGQGVKTGRFGPVQVEVDISDPNGWGADLPPLHQRPWPKLRENEGCYDVGEQLMLTLAERVESRIDVTGISFKDAGLAESKCMPDELRKHLPRGKDTWPLLRAKIASLPRLRLPTESV